MLLLGFAGVGTILARQSGAWTELATLARAAEPGFESKFRVAQDAVALFTRSPVLGIGRGAFIDMFPAIDSQPIGVVHTHLLTLGFIILLVVLALEKLFGLSRSRLFGWFFWVYNAGIILTTAMMLWHGSLTVLGQEGNGMISGIAGLGHILLTAGMVLLFLSLRRGLVLDGVIHDPASAYAANSQAAKADANNTGAVA